MASLQLPARTGLRLGQSQQTVVRPVVRPLGVVQQRRAVITCAGNDRDVSTRVAEVVAPTTTLGDAAAAAANDAVRWAQMSYSQQYDELYKNKPINPKKVVPKPSKTAQMEEPGVGRVFLSDVATKGKRPSFLNRDWNSTDKAFLAFIGGMHLLACCAPFTYSPQMVALFLASYFVTGCLGITLSYHRMLSHKSFTVPKWLEYILAYCGVLAVQGDPLEWSSSHRYHHLHTDTPLDPHSPYEGFWWCHMGWLLDNNATMERVSNRSNADDLESQWYYRWLRDTYPFHVAAQLAVLFLVGGFPAVVWGGALRMCWVWHITWFVNSASHCWGYQDYNTGDLSKNNWWVGILAFGEGWHNNHHAFEFSARHGFEWWQVDMTWYIILALQKVGLATNVKLPTERQKAKLAFKKPAEAAA
ncbi:hypothetical protein CHLRE_09g397250v5 [Chlamydomonas reinhardtii]|uniref:Fatty acid desaturase domain-containing protein n=1 Tax=Chlamydomonas reinhardtii TaxID=3055 RepID=A0A2K3DD32_CHLRE|nr:uncharacterized protein CHLRE_09g397250v5 [Chlamydomonas reinhardtii]PNW78440.1 hypothetical protein CHLRE_09g397250v5 [Chlamydomonas reinhardtii]